MSPEGGKPNYRQRELQEIWEEERTDPPSPEEIRRQLGFDLVDPKRINQIEIDD